MSDSLRLRLQAALGTAYVLERELTGGGMSRVFLARDTMLGRQVVLKVLPPETASREPAMRFRHEAILAARLQHPHIVPVYSVGEVDDIQYFTMPFIDGESLRARLERRRSLPAVDARRVLREIGGALACAHGHGIVHRDVKPENIFIERRTGRAMLADFGVALALGEPDGVTQPGVTVGTPTYMSPEQVDGGRVTGLSDIYSLGLVGWEMLTGERPWSGDSLYDVMYKQKHEILPPFTAFNVDIAPSLAGAIDRALRKDPATRWPRADAFVAALDPEDADRSGVVEPGAETAATAPVVEAYGAGGGGGGGGATDEDALTVVARVRNSGGRGDRWTSADGWRTSKGGLRYGRWDEPRRSRLVPATVLVLLVAAVAASAATVGRRYLPAAFSTAGTIVPSAPAGARESPVPDIDTVSVNTVASGLAAIGSGARPLIALEAPRLESAPVRLAAVPAGHPAHHARRVYVDARSGTSVRARVATAELELHSYERVMATAPGAHPIQPPSAADHSTVVIPSAPSVTPPLAPAVPAPASSGPNTEAPAVASPDARPALTTPPSDTRATRASAVRVTPSPTAATAVQAASPSCRPSFPGSHVCRVYDERTGRVLDYQYIPSGVPARSP